MYISNSIKIAIWYSGIIAWYKELITYYGVAYMEETQIAQWF
jgi:hypothetical protein